MRINRRNFLASFGAASLARRQQASARPDRNILIIVADDQGLDLGCYGNKLVQTPNLDRLAGESVRFPNAFTPTASCSASRSVILTGLFNHANGQVGHAHKPHNFHTHEFVRSQPRLLREHGYLTAVIGKLHVQPAAQYPFDVVAEGNTRDVAAMSAKAGQVFRRARAEKRPFYVHIGFGDPHRAGQGFANDRAHAGVTPVVYDPARVEVPYFLPDRPEVHAEIAEYYQAISRLDQGVGMLLAELRKAGGDDDTLVIYLSDNGMPFTGAKASLYDPGIRLPLLVRALGLKRRGGVSNAMVGWTDLVPTCLDWAGARGPDYALHGRSFLPTLDQESPNGWDEVFLSHTFHGVLDYYPARGIRTRTHKYFRNLLPEMLYPLPSDLFASQTWQGILQRKDTMMGQRPVETFLKRPAEELYDLGKDPRELNNVAGSAQYAEALAACRRKVDEMEQRTCDPWWEFQLQRRGVIIRGVRTYCGAPGSGA